MDIKLYLSAYDRDEERLVKWLRENGANLLHAYAAINKFANDNRKFESGYELDHELLKEALKGEQEPIKQYIDFRNLPWYKRIWKGFKV